jgi:hypothetical protein
MAVFVRLEDVKLDVSRRGGALPQKRRMADTFEADGGVLGQMWFAGDLRRLAAIFTASGDPGASGTP